MYNIGNIINQNNEWDALLWDKRFKSTEFNKYVKSKNTASTHVSFTSMDDAFKLDKIVMDIIHREARRGEIFATDYSNDGSREIWGASEIDGITGGELFWMYSFTRSYDGGGSITLKVSSDSALNDSWALAIRVKNALLEVTSSKDESLIDVSTYWVGTHGLQSFNSTIDVPRWEEVQGNYTSSTKDSVNGLLNNIYAPSGGKLIVWHGPPGTGKTWAIRSLIRELKDKYKPVIISDANTFLEDISYYFSIVEMSNKPCLFILEDSAESILSESRSYHGHRVSKLLNMTDGIVSQGREDLFLITFNEEIEEVDRAVVRSGRCLNITEFKELTEEESIAWLADKGKEDIVLEEKSYTIADLYAITSGKEIFTNTISKKERVGMGFR